MSRTLPGRLSGISWVRRAMQTPSGDGHRSSVWSGLTGGDAHQGCFAGAISTEQTDPFAFLDLEVQVVQDGRAAEADIDVEETE